MKSDTFPIYTATIDYFGIYPEESVAWLSNEFGTLRCRSKGSVNTIILAGLTEIPKNRLVYVNDKIWFRSKEEMLAAARGELKNRVEDARFVLRNAHYVENGISRMEQGLPPYDDSEGEGE